MCSVIVLKNSFQRGVFLHDNIKALSFRNKWLHKKSKYRFDMFRAMLYDVIKEKRGGNKNFI